ncbi:hypothetical protein K457DRAFT_84858, partial [Linnemannia elongata AG-77]
MKERERLQKFWTAQAQAELQERYTRLQDQIQCLFKRVTEAHDEIRRGILRKAYVIGMTTNGAAKFQSMLAALSPKIIICEEAGEVLESHILAALSGSTQHLILIGDHLQLRPQIATYVLSSDSRQGRQYNLDRSLFERLVNTGRIPSSPLTVQRRMRSEICNLVRHSVYEYLVDGEQVLEYPDVSGMAANVFFMDHRHPEDSRDQYGIQSYANTFEAEMVKALVLHLIKNGYQQSNIAILTPYLGQLSRLRDTLGDIVRLAIDERDQEQLDALTDGKPAAYAPWKTVTTNRTLTLRTIDNFQGEEADIIIISLVRSDTREDLRGSSATIGFLKSLNRTNVLLSRARHGMYLIGNAPLMDQPQNGIWHKVMDELRRNDRIGDGFLLRCRNHPETEFLVSCPADFKTYAPNGGCTKLCDQVVQCGHVCTMLCHSDDKEHQRFKCAQPCPRLHPQCNHVCLKECGQECGDCQQPIGTLPLPCAHVLAKAYCFQRQDPSRARCKERVVRKLPHCEHEHPMDCYKDPETFKCHKRCDVLLDCGHACFKHCFECQAASLRVDGLLDVPPSGKCGKLMHCGHSCDAYCHLGDECPPCKQSCILTCTHSRCTHPCKTLCPACCESCVWSCSHQGRCQLPCGAPCSRLPCNRRCEKTLSCGHQCPSVCGEKCPSLKYCIECKIDPSVMDMIVDLIMQVPLSDVDVNEDPLLVLPCGHALVMSSLDGLMEMNDYYEEDINVLTGEVSFVKTKSLPNSEVPMIGCPSCRAPIVRLVRYGRRIKYSQLVMRLKKFEMLQSAAVTEAEKMFTAAQDAVHKNLPAFLDKISKVKSPNVTR